MGCSHDWGEVSATAALVSSAKDSIYRRLTAGGVQPFPGILQLVTEAAAAGVRIGVGSSGDPDKIRHSLTSAGLWHLFEERAVVSAQHVGGG